MDGTRCHFCGAVDACSVRFVRKQMLSKRHDLSVTELEMGTAKSDSEADAHHRSPPNGGSDAAHGHGPVVKRWSIEHRKCCPAHITPIDCACT